MDRKNRISDEGDRLLLSEIEAAIEGDGSVLQRDDSHYSFCTQIAAMVPQPSQDFRQNLDSKLIGVWRQQQVTWKQQASQPRVSPGHAPAGSDTDLSTARRLLIHKRRRMPFGNYRWIGALALILAVIFSWVFVPPVRAFAGNLVRQLILGNFFKAEQLDVQPEQTPPASGEAIWVIETDIGSYGGQALSGDAAVRTFMSVEEAQQEVDFPIILPEYLPEGYILREVKLPPEGVAEGVYLFYSGPGRDIVIIQSVLGEESSESTDQVSVTIHSSVIATSGTLEETRVRDHPAAWMDETILAWEAGNIECQVGGLDLTLDEALRIAESMEEK